MVYVYLDIVLRGLFDKVGTFMSSTCPCIMHLAWAKLRPDSSVCIPFCILSALSQ